MKAKTSRSALISSFTALLLCFAMLIGTTFAWFTDEVKSGVNTIVAGNLDIDVLHTSASVTTAESISGQTDLFTDKAGHAMKWEPGAVSYETFTVSNAGTLAFKYNMSMNVTDYNAVNVEGAAYTLLDALRVIVLEDSNIQSTVTRDSVAALDWNNAQTLKDFTKTNKSLYPTSVSEAGKASSETFQVIVYWQPTDNDNNWNVNNGKTTTDGQPLFIEFGVNVVATQLQHESDSFGTDYDENVMIPNLPTNVNKTFESAPIAGTTYNAAESVTVVNKNSENAQVAEVPAAAVKAIVEKAAAAAATDMDATKDVNTVIYLNIETANVSAGTASYNIDLTAVMTYTNTSGEAKQVALSATEVDEVLGNNIVEANVNIGTGLTDVTVKHNDEPMTKLDSADANEVGFFYSAGTGDLTIKTSSFSPFTVEYKVVERVASVVAENGAESNFPSLTAAMEAAQDGETVKLWKNTDIAHTEISKSLTLDLNGYTLTATSTSNFAVTISSEFAITDSSANPGKIVECATYGIYASGSDANLSISNITVESSGSYAFIAQSGATINITSGTYNKGFYNFNSTLNITGGKFAAPVLCANGYGMRCENGWFVVNKVEYISAAESFSVPVDTEKKIVTITSAEELALLVKGEGKYIGYTVLLANDIDAEGKTWKSVRLHSESGFGGFKELDGQGHTISNLLIEGQGLFNTYQSSEATTIKNITFDGVTNLTSTLNVSLIAAQVYSDLTLENVKVVNSAFSGTYKVAPLVATVYDEKPATVTLTVKDCSVKDTKVIGTSYDFMICGMIAFVNEEDNDHVVFEGNNVIENVTLKYPSTRYGAVAAIYCNDGSATGCVDSAENVTVTNVTKVKA